MRTSLLVVGLAVGFIVASLSCGTAPKCSATTCPTGCCDTSGLCQTAGSASACGSRGSACTSCGVTASCVAGACMQNIGAGAGSSGTGGGTSGTGGGTANAGGTAGTAGGTAGTAGGTSATGGGTATTGGGSSGTGGGTSGTGGGTSGTGGGSASSTVFCNRLLAAQTRFFAGRSSCPGGAITLTPGFNASACAATWNVCNDADRGYLNQIAMCLESAQVCTTGNESAASAGFLQCLSLSEALSDACAASLQSP